MNRMSSKKPKLRQSEAQELADRVKELRESLVITQTHLAVLLEVSRSQIGEWETGGDEQPSAEKLLLMAKLALSSDLRRWLLLKAGLDLEMIRREFEDEFKLALEMRSSTKPFEVPVFDVGALVSEPDHSLAQSYERIGLPLKVLDHPTSTICVRYGSCPPWSMSPDGLAVIDRAVANPDSLVGKMVAVLALQLPPWTELSLPRRSESTWAEPLLWPKVEPARRRKFVAVRSGLVIGRFGFECDEEFVHGGWRLVLHLGLQNSKQTRFCLSPWLSANEPPTGLERLIVSDYRIVGEVIGWIKDPTKQALK